MREFIGRHFSRLKTHGLCVRPREAGRDTYCKRDEFNPYKTGMQSCEEWQDGHETTKFIERPCEQMTIRERNE